MAETKATPRKKPVRKAPVQKDYPTKLDWLRAMTEYEVKQAEAEAEAKVARLDKRIIAKQAVLAKAQADIERLKEARRQIMGETVEVEMPEDEVETPSA